MSEMTPPAAPLAMCWSCKGPVPGDDLFCPTCKAVQPPGQRDHFARLGLERGFTLDPSALERAYFARQGQLHPDRFAARPPRERAISQAQATAVNEAYETLKEPLARAQYLLGLAGVAGFGDPRGEDRTVDDPSVLAEAMELREELLGADDESAVTALSVRVEETKVDLIEALAEAFGQGDLDRAARDTLRLKYLCKLAQDIRVHRARIRATA